MSQEPSSSASVVHVAPGVRLPRSVLRFSYTRSSGPGGQHVNKVSTKVRLHVAMADLAPHLTAGALERLETIAGDRITQDGDLVLSADTTRSQVTNRQACLARLRALIVEAQHRPRPRRATRPSRASKRRRLESKKRRAETKRRRRPPSTNE